MNNEVIEKQVAELYDSSMPYHNFAHAQSVLDESRQIIDKCKTEGIFVADDVVYYACLLHDAGYHEDEKEKGFSSKEAYSAHLAEQLLNSHSIPADTVDAVKTAIMSTHRDGVCKSNEDKVVRAADLSGLAANYEIFKNNTKKLKQEYFLLYGQNIEWQTWRQKAVDVIEQFLREDMPLTEDYYNPDGESVFHLKARENLQRLLNDDVE